MKLICVLMLSAVSVCCFAQNENEIVERYRLALKRTVEASADEVQSIVGEGEFKVKTFSFPGQFYQRGNLMRLEFTFQNMHFLTISNDSMKYEYNPVNKQSTLTKIGADGDDSGDKKDSFDFLRSDLLEYQKRDLPLKLIKKLKIDSVQAYKLELGLEPRSRKKKAIIYINSKSNLIYKIEDAGGTRYFMKYLEDKNGYVFPRHMIESSARQSLEAVFTKFDFNVSLPDSLFVIPKAARPAQSPKVKALEKQGDSLFNAGNFLAARAKYSEAIKLYSDSPTLFNARGQTKLKTESYYEAIGDFTSAIELDSTFSNGYNNRGLAKFNLKDANGAVADYTKALKYKHSIIVLRNRGSAYLNLQKWTEAADDFNEALKIDSIDHQALYKYGIAQAQLQHYELALRFYKRAIENGFPLNEVNNYRGVSYYKLGQYDSAAISFEKAVELEPENEQYIINYIHALYAMQDYKSALKELDTKQKKGPKTADAYNLMGLCKFNDEDFKGAAFEFSRAIEMDSSNHVYFSNRASAKEETEDYEGAIVDYSSAIVLHPTDANNFYKRGLLKVRTSKKIEGCMDLGTANEMKHELANEAILEHCH